MSADNQPIRGFYPLTVGTPVSPGRLFVITATVAGDVTVELTNGSTHVISAPVGYTAYPYSVRQVTASTATATYANGL